MKGDFRGKRKGWERILENKRQRRRVNEGRKGLMEWKGEGGIGIIGKEKHNGEEEREKKDVWGIIEKRGRGSTKR